LIKVICTGCNKSYNIPDEKIPAGKELDLPCPSCKTIIKITAGQPDEINDIAVNGPKGKELMVKIIKTSKALPPMPEIMVKATEVLGNENAGFKEVANVLETDQAMATRVLKLANSAYYGLSVPVANVQQASALLGFQALLDLITVVSTSKMMGKSLEGYDLDSTEVWAHSLSVAVGAKIIAEKKFPSHVNNAFDAGLIHDSGMIIIDQHIKENKKAFLGLKEKGLSVQDAEKKILGFNHAEIASEFFKKWNLPPEQTRAIKYHHFPSESDGDELSYILHVADYISFLSNPQKKYDLEDGALSFVGLEEDQLEELGQEIKESVNDIIHGMTS